MIYKKLYNNGITCVMKRDVDVFTVNKELGIDKIV